MSDPESRGEQFAVDLEEAVEEQIQAWVDEEGSAHREGEFICIREEELTENLLLMNAITYVQAVEDEESQASKGS